MPEHTFDDRDYLIFMPVVAALAALVKAAPVVDVLVTRQAEFRVRG